MKFFFCFGEKPRETENREKNNSSRPTFFCPPYLGGKLSDRLVYAETRVFSHPRFFSAREQ